VCDRGLAKADRGSKHKVISRLFMCLSRVITLTPNIH
jgi:hypothetical protein